MAYQTGDSILDDHYNAFVAGDPFGSSTEFPFSINRTAGVGFGTTGLNLTEIDRVSAGDTITAAQWSALLGRITNLANHYGSSITSGSSVSTGDPLSAITTLTTDLQTVYYAVKNGTTPAGGTITETSKLTPTNAGIASGQGIQCIQTVTFAGGDEARAFFNAGGQLQIQMSASGGSGIEDTRFLNMVAIAGKIRLGGQSTTRVAGSGTTYTDVTPPTGSPSVLDTAGYYGLTNTYQTIFLATMGEMVGYDNYTSAFMKVEAKTDGSHADARGNTGNVIYLRTTVDYGSATGGDGGTLNAIESTYTCTLTERAANATQLGAVPGFGTPVYADVSFSDGNF
jgi:hypothetical protein